MTRQIEPIRASVGGIDITVTKEFRRRVRRAARKAVVLTGYLAGIAGVTCAVVAVVQSPLVWAVLGCGAVAGWIVRRMSV